MNKRWREVVVWFGVGLYLASLLLPTAAPFNPEFSDTTYAGWVAFRIGLGALLALEPFRLDWWLLGGAWLANPAIWLSIVLLAYGHCREAAKAAGCGLILSLLILPKGYVTVGGLPGYWVWVSSAALLFAGSAFFAWKDDGQTHGKNGQSPEDPALSELQG